MDGSRKAYLARKLLELLVDEKRSHQEKVSRRAEEVLADPDPDFEAIWLACRAMMNVRPPWPASPELLLIQDELLPALIQEAGMHTVADSKTSSFGPQMRLWRGDITTLAVDAIVNAANSGMTGCWGELHYCIDNAIHTFAGVQLRIEMARLMDEEHLKDPAFEEPTGSARITSGYNLPAKHIIHTVGPIARGNPTDEHRRQLAQCYTSCLDLASSCELLSIAFCCISTGVFGFPQKEAADIAVTAVREWLEQHPDSPLLVVFNVFGEENEEIYRGLLGI